MKKVLLLSALFLMPLLLSCGSDPAAAVNAEVKSFMDSVQAGNIDAAVGMVQNKMDMAVPDKIKSYFTDNAVTAYTIIPDDDPKAKAAMDMGMATIDVSLDTAAGKKKVRFIMGKSPDDKWVIKNLMTELP